MDFCWILIKFSSLKLYLLIYREGSHTVIKMHDFDFVEKQVKETVGYTSASLTMGYSF